MMKLGIDHPAEIKARYKLVRRDNFKDITAEIIEADEETGEAKVLIDGKTESLSLGPGGFAITARGR